VIRAFEIFEQFLNFFEVRQPQLHRLHDKWFSNGPRCGRQTQPQKAIYHLFEGFARFARFPVQQGGHVVIQCKSRAHIMMLSLEHHDVKSILRLITRVCRLFRRDSGYK